MKKALVLFLVLSLFLAAAGCSPSSSSLSRDDVSGSMEDGVSDAYAGEAPSDSSLSGGNTGDEEWRYQPLDMTEEYDSSPETTFKDVLTSPLSTFSSDVDTASYSNMRRFINDGQKPEGVRIEELVNYFNYEYPYPSGESEHPFTVTAEIAECPWNQDHLLAMIGVQGAELEARDTASNIVFLIDVSGSMNDNNKLPLLKEAFKLLIESLGDDDIISIVTYAGSDRVLDDSVHGGDKRKLTRIIDSLSSGGSTAGAQGITTAYELAEKNYIEGGNNRVILATDGDFNVGMSSVDDLTRLIESKRDNGVFISVLGFGMYNLKDNMMESIADHGNGNYAYIDNINEAKKVLVEEFDSTLYVIAKDLKLQVEFNPALVSQYRLIGYNNRRLENEDFNDDRKDAGDVGAGHSVTASYELIPAEGEESSGVDSLKYQTPVIGSSREYMTVKVRYKEPDGETSKLVEKTVSADSFTLTPSRNFVFASSVAEFGLILTDSDFKANANIQDVINAVGKNLGEDEYGLREEFVGLVRRYDDLFS